MRCRLHSPQAVPQGVLQRERRHPLEGGAGAERQEPQEPRASPALRAPQELSSMLLLMFAAQEVAPLGKL